MDSAGPKYGNLIRAPRFRQPLNGVSRVKLGVQLLLEAVRLDPGMMATVLERTYITGCGRRRGLATASHG